MVRGKYSAAGDAVRQLAYSTVYRREHRFVRSYTGYDDLPSILFDTFSTRHVVYDTYSL